MSYTRIHVRVPIKGEALLFVGKDTFIKAQAIDISHGGVAITNPEVPLTKDRYDILITTKAGQQIKVSACLVRQEGEVLGFNSEKIDSDSLKIITDLVFEYQQSLDFVDQVMKHNLFDHCLLDDEGKRLEITFDVDP